MFILYVCVQVRAVLQWSETFQDGRTQQPRVPGESAKAVTVVHVPLSRPDWQAQLMDNDDVAMAVRSSSRVKPYCIVNVVVVIIVSSTRCVSKLCVLRYVYFCHR